MCNKSRKFIIIYFSFCLCDIEGVLCFMNLIVLMEICPLKVRSWTGWGGRCYYRNTRAAIRTHNFSILIPVSQPLGHTVTFSKTPVKAMVYWYM